MNSRTLGPGAALLVAVLSFVLAGCETPRERALARGRPAELALIPSEVLPKIALAGDERAAMRPFRYSDHQSVHILQVAPSAKLRKRYHTRQDLTLICIQGSAVVEVEGQRHFIARGSAVSIPQFHSYTVIPHGSREVFTAIAVFSPPYDVVDAIIVAE